MTYTTEKRITSNNADKLLNDLLEQIKLNNTITIDMCDTVFISSSGLRSLLIATKSLRAKNLPQLKIINISPEVFSIIEMTGFDWFFTIV